MNDLWEVISPFRSHTCKATGGGSRSLSILSVSASFKWTAHQVAKLGNQRNTIIYILAKESLILPDEEVQFYLLCVCRYLT